MGVRERIEKLERLSALKNKVVQMFWVEDVTALTQDQIDSSNQIYVYLEI